MNKGKIGRQQRALERLIEERDSSVIHLDKLTKLNDQRFANIGYWVGRIATLDSRIDASKRAIKA